MRTLFTEVILFSTLLLENPPLFGRGEPARQFRYSQISLAESLVRGYCLGARSGGYVTRAIYEKEAQGNASQGKASLRTNRGFSAFGK
jgi:hypothetical protein